MNYQLVFVHGRSQEHKDAVNLKSQWIAAWTEGLQKNGLQIPIAESQIRFPYFGQTLYDLVNNVPDDKLAEIVIKGAGDDEKAKAFMVSVIEEVRQGAGITHAQVAAATDQDVGEKGVLNWGWVQGVLTAIDQHVPGGSGASIALATRDVYEYLGNPGIRDSIETGVSAAITPGIPTIVVGHSLGTVVAYNLLRREGTALGWKVPLFVTVGSPLGVTAIKKALRPIQFPACATKWYNAMDDRDVVALYPLDAQRFDVNPAIENNTGVRNQTENRHGIAGYLNDKEVAKRIYDALMV